MKICIVALGAYPLLTGKATTQILGPAVYSVLLAQELVRHNFKVAVITYNNGGAPVEYVDGIEVIKSCTDKRYQNIAVSAFHIGVMLVKALKKADADIYLQDGTVGFTLPFCKLNNRPFVFRIGSDWYVDKSNQHWGHRSRLVSNLTIKFADVVIVQSESQKILLRKNFGKDSLVIKSHILLTERGIPEKKEPPIVLWVGSMYEVKQPELFLKLAKAIPETTFQIIGGYSSTSDQSIYNYNRIKKDSQVIPNVEFLGFIPFNEINEYFSQAAIFVNTSKFEGFPNTFIQAWMNYTPVVSLNSNPDEIICKYKLGFHSKTFCQLVEDVKVLIKDKHLRQEIGKNGRHYIEKEHDINNIVDQYIKVFDELLRR